MGFKVTIVKLTSDLDVKAMEIAESLGLHPVMVYRWQQVHREGESVMPISSNKYD